MAHSTWDLGGLRLHRVGYLDVGVDGRQLFDVDVDVAPSWTEPWRVDGQVGIGLAFWVIEAGEQLIVVDPVCAADPFIRSGADALVHQEAAFANFNEAGFDRHDVTDVVLTHLDGMGMAAWADLDGDGGGDDVMWSSAFPNARMAMSTEEREYLAGTDDAPGQQAYDALEAQRLIDSIEPSEPLAPGVTALLTGGHSPGHLVLDLVGSERELTMLGHLAVTPFHVLDETNAGQHFDDAAGARAQRSELDRVADGQTLVAGSLWPAPGVATIQIDGGPRIVPSI